MLGKKLRIDSRQRMARIFPPSFSGAGGIESMRHSIQS